MINSPKTKAQTLEYLSGKVKIAKVLPFLYFKVPEWISGNQDKIINKIFWIT